MASFYDAETEKQKGTKSLDIALPLLAALEAVGSSIASKGQNVTSNALGLYKDVQSQRQAALDRALGRDKAAADTARQDKLLGFQEAREGREKSEFERLGASRTAEQKRMEAVKRQLLGSPAEMDPATGTEVRPAVPGVQGLTDLDKAAIETDLAGWIANKLKPQSMNFFMSEGGLVQVPKVGGQAQTVTTPDGSLVKPPKKPEATGPGKPPPGYRWAADGSLEAIPGGPAAVKAEKAKQDHEAFKMARASEIEGIQEFSRLAKNLAGNKYIGGVTGAGALGKFVPGSPWADANADLDRLISMGAIETMAKLKRESPTGSTGFGALSQQELKVIQDSFAALKDKNQSPDKMRAELKRVAEGMERYLQRIEDPNAKAPETGDEKTSGSGSIPEGTEKINAQGVKVRMTGGKWRVVQ